MYGFKKIYMYMCYQWSGGTLHTNMAPRSRLALARETK